MSGNGQILMLVLRLIHILAGVFWVGAAITLAGFVLPSVRAGGPAAGSFMREIGRRKLPPSITLAALFTILSGVGLYWRQSALSNGTWARSPMGITIGIGAVFALVAGILGGTFARSTGTRLMVLGQEIMATGGPPSGLQREEMERLQDRLIRITSFLVVLLVIATAMMAIGRYV
jgi:hypothetical protein